MAPEQASGSDDVGPAADVYALDGILYEVLCRRPPFTGTDIADVLQQVQTSEPIPLRMLCPRMARDENGMETEINETRTYLLFGKLSRHGVSDYSKCLIRSSAS